MSSDVFVDFRDAAFTYDGEAFVFRHLNLTVPQGQFLCLLGGNGSGKSTLAKHINALLLPDEGEVDVFGCDTRDAEQTYFIRSNAGLVFQNPDDQLVASLIENDVAFGPENLGIPNPELRERVTRALAEVGLQGFEANPDDQLVASLIENDVAFGPENLGIPNPELRERVTRALAEVGLQGFEAHETNALSGGQKQRVAIAGVLAMDPAILILDEATAMLDPRGRAGLMRVVRELHERGMTVGGQKQRVAIAGVLAMDPAILILDEATAMLDPRGRAGLMRVVRELHERGMTVVMITHFMEEAAAADRVVVLDGGEVRMDGAPEEVLVRADELRSLSLEVPFACRLSLELQAAGVPVSTCITDDRMDGAPEEVLVRADELRSLSLEVPFACRLSLELQAAGVPVSTCITDDTLKEELCALRSKM